MGLFPPASRWLKLLLAGSVFWLLTFAFCLGFGTTIAESVLTAVAAEAAVVGVAEGGVIPNTLDEMEEYADGLRFHGSAVGDRHLTWGAANLKRLPIQYMIIGSYIMVVPPLSPLKTSLGLRMTRRSDNIDHYRSVGDSVGRGLASAIKGETRWIDGFGLIAFASLLPMMFVMVYGMVWWHDQRAAIYRHLLGTVMDGIPIAVIIFGFH